jgi:hypothetical protein
MDVDMDMSMEISGLTMDDELVPPPPIESPEPMADSPPPEPAREQSADVEPCMPVYFYCMLTYV